MSDNLRRISAGGIALMVLVLQGAPLRASTVVEFRSPSGGIGCEQDDQFLRCDVTGGVVPLPPQPKSCQLDWGQGLEMGRRGRATVVCAGDTALGGTIVVRYGTTWRRDGFSCASSTDGMRCTNTVGHGFFISRGGAHTF
jgi:hypothetical protein